MPFVLDASVVIAWVIGEDATMATHTRRRFADDQAVVPSSWWFEVRNALLVNERRGRIREVRTAEFLHELAETAILPDAEPLEAQLLALARKHRLTVYDAAYLELALRRRLPLATLDTALAEAARAEGAELIGEDRS